MTLKDIPKNCHCGKKMHLSPSQKILIKHSGGNWGKEKLVKILGGKTYKVPTYYILLHGLKGKDLPNLGFPEDLTAK